MTSNGKPRPCARCGIPRKGRVGVALCHDCRAVLSREEQSAWGYSTKSVESSHRKKAA